MRKIIKGVRFDTEKAVEVGHIATAPKNDHTAIQAKLYRTPRSGRYFLAGEGGPMTLFGRPVPGEQNTRMGGTGIVPLSREDALSLAEQHLTPQTVEQHFDVEDA